MNILMHESQLRVPVYSTQSYITLYKSFVFQVKLKITTAFVFVILDRYVNVAAHKTTEKQ